MDKLDQLFIRACKAEEPRKRLESIYRRFYLSRGTFTPTVVYNLARIVDENSMYSVVDIVSDLSPTFREDFHAMTHHEKFLDILIDKIRYTGIRKFNGLTIPKRFK